VVEVLGLIARPAAAALVALWAATVAHAQDRPVAFELALVDLAGNKEVLGTLPPSVFAPRVSPDGQSVAFELADPEAPDAARRLWVAPLRDIDARRTLPHAGGAASWAPLWTPDGERLVFLVTSADASSRCPQRRGLDRER
jgi:Tol biopolymer transport system component